MSMSIYWGVRTEKLTKRGRLTEEQGPAWPTPPLHEVGRGGSRSDNHTLRGVSRGCQPN